MTEDVRDKLAEILRKPIFPHKLVDPIEAVADYLIANGVTVQKHGYWEEVVEIKDNTVCGDGAQVKHKRCSCCKQPMGFVETAFCSSCGAIMDGEDAG